METRKLNQETEEWLLTYLNGDIDEAESERVGAWLNEHPDHRAAYEALLRDYLHIRWAQEDGRIQTTPAWRRVAAVLRHKQRWLRWTAAAASIALVCGVAIWLSRQPEKPQPAAVAEIHPVSTKATLVLSSGRTIDLATARQEIKEQDGSRLAVDSAAGIRYDSLAGEPVTREVIYNKIIVPRGGEYFITLADGTGVWLDADSELEYPVQFNAGDRQVKLRGKAYFSVTKNAAKPFIVRVDDFSVRVYGTEFNVEAYDPRRVETVLVEGSVGFRVGTDNPEQRLKPNQLAVVDATTGRSEVRDVNVAPYVAWRHRDIVFIDEPLERIMDDVARWYDVDVFFQNEELKRLRFDCNLPRYSDIRDLFFFMERTSDARFSVNGRTVVVSKK